jgi:hypothetical protein
MAAEIRARVASFRAHQERFNREREEYFAATLARLRAVIKDMPSPRPNDRVASSPPFGSLADGGNY